MIMWTRCTALQAAFFGSVLWSLCGLSLDAAAVNETLPHGIKGVRAEYEVMGGAVAKPPLTRIVMSVPAIEKTNGEKRAWFQLEAFAGERRLYAVALLVPSLDFLGPDVSEVTAYRYVLFPGTDQPLEYVSARTGRAMLPAFDFFNTLLPHAAAGQEKSLLGFGEGTYLGRSIRLVKKGHGARLLAVADAKRLVLDPDVSIGTGRNFKDAEGRRMYTYGIPYPAGEPDYTYTPLTAEDYRVLIADVGMNRFPVAANQLPFMIDQPVFFLLTEGFGDLPELLYRSNFIGSAQFMDEPVWIAGSGNTLADVKTPQEAAARVVESIRKKLASADSGGERNLMECLKQAGYDFGNLEILQGGIPVWDTSQSGAWYEFEAGLPGYVYEGRFRPPKFAKFMKDALDIDFPAEIEPNLMLHYAFFRGAARHFGRKWGVGIYGQTALEATPAVFPMAYEEGASYFWFWTSDHAHHVAFPEQKQLTRQFKEYMQSRPRKASPEELTARAKVAVVLPWGYIFGDWDINHGVMWGSPNLKLDNDNGHGATYKAVLRAGMEEALRLLKQGTRFDILFLRENERAGGYGEVYRVLENGKIVVE